MGSIGDLSQSLRRTCSARVTRTSSSRFTPSAPKIHEAPPSFSQQRGGATPTKSIQPVIPPPKPKFSLEEQISIVERLKSGDFNKAMGLEQFRIEKDLTGQVKPYSKSKPGKKKREEKKKPSLPIPLSPSEELPDFLELLGGTEKNYAELPDHIKHFDSILVSQITCFKMMYKNAALFADITFAKALKPKVIVSIHRQMVRLTNIIQKFLRLSAWDKAQAFNPEKSKKTKQGEQRSHLHCRLEDQTKVAESVLKATQNLEKLRQFLAAQKPEDFDVKMKDIQNLADSLESKLKKLNDASVKFNEVLKTSEDIETEYEAADEEDDTDTDSSSDSSDDKDSEDDEDADLV